MIFILKNRKEKLKMNKKRFSTILCVLLIAGIANPPTVINVQPLLKTNWNQTSSNDGYCDSYNYHAPNSNGNCTCYPDGGVKCPAGCVAVAMAQIMKYWNYPVYLSNKIKQYDWCNMSDKLYYWGLLKFIFHSFNFSKSRNPLKTF
jgi:hypothetical protein